MVFCTYGHYQYYVMPYGLVNAPTLFQSFMNDILTNRFVIVYLDNMLIHSKNLNMCPMYARSFVEGMRRPRNATSSSLMAPLMDLLKEKLKKMGIMALVQSTFQSLKELFMTAPVLK